MKIIWICISYSLLCIVNTSRSSPIIPFPAGEESKKTSNENDGKKFTSFQCIGGSQVFKTESLKQASIKVFPLNDPEFRTCHFRNVCLINGILTYFQKYPKEGEPTQSQSQPQPPQVPKEYLPSGFDGKINHLSYLRGFTMPIETVYGRIPANYRFHNVSVVFLDSNSWSFNYGHYLNDNIMPTFITSKIFRLNYDDSQQLFETSCRLFSTLEPAFSDRLVTYNRSMGTYRQACLHRLNSMWPYFFKFPPLYIDDDFKQKSICFKNLITGQGSTFGLKSIDLSRALYFRDFRDFVIQRNHLRIPEKQENLILVGLRTVGSAGGGIINDLCELVHKAKGQLSSDFQSKYSVECFVPSNLSFEDEIYEVQRAKVIISVHGTISYMALFTRDGTQQISIANPKELKENQMLLYATHFHTLYLTWDKLKELSGVLEHALTLSEEYHSSSQ